MTFLEARSLLNTATFDKERWCYVIEHKFGTTCLRPEPDDGWSDDIVQWFAHYMTQRENQFPTIN